MGTRNLTIVQLDGNYKVAQYGQWDGYPSGQGATVLAFLNSMIQEDFREEFKTKVRGCRFLTEAEYKADDVFEKYPQLSRDHGAEILNLVAESENGLVLKNSINFAGDSLFCEWAYVLDFDREALEVYKDFNETPLTESDRFHDQPLDKEGSRDYKQIRIVASFPFSELPDEDSFCAQCDPEEVES